MAASYPRSLVATRNAFGSTSFGNPRVLISTHLSHSLVLLHPIDREARNSVGCSTGASALNESARQGRARGEVIGTDWR